MPPGLDGPNALAAEAGLGQTPAQPRNRMFHHALMRALQSLVRLEQPQPSRAREHSPPRGKQSGQCIRRSREVIEQHEIESPSESLQIPRPEGIGPCGQQDAAG